MKELSDIALEQAVLGGMMLEKDALYEGLSLLEQNDFFEQKNVEVFSCIKELDELGGAVDILTVSSKARAKGFGVDAVYITELTSRVNQTGNLSRWCYILKQLAKKRQLLLISAEITAMSKNLDSDVFLDIDKIQEKLSDLVNVSSLKKTSHIKQLADDDLKRLEEIKSGELVAGFKFGLSSFDRIQVVKRGHLVILAARPAMGKTATMLQLALNTAKQGYKCLVFSLEMTKPELYQRLIANESEINYEKVQNALMQQHEYEHYVSASNRLGNLDLFVDDTPGITPTHIRNRAREIKNRHGLDFIFVDYLQLMRYSGKTVNNRENEISMISQSLKGLAKDFDVPIIALSQLNRAVETRGGDKRPQMSDLRESGGIEQDADSIYMLYRPEYYGIKEDEEGNSTAGMLEGICVKNRGGKTGTAIQKAELHIQRISDFDELAVIEPSKEVQQYENLSLPPQTDISSNLF